MAIPGDLRDLAGKVLRLDGRSEARGQALAGNGADEGEGDADQEPDQEHGEDGRGGKSLSDLVGSYGRKEEAAREGCEEKEEVPATELMKSERPRKGRAKMVAVRMVTQTQEAPSNCL